MNDKAPAMTEETTNGAAQDAQSPQFSLQRIYVRDLSFEAPKSPEIFRQDWTPSVALDLNTRQKPLEGDFHEVVLTLSVTVKNGEETAFIAEVQQAGIFLIKNLDAASMSHTLGAFCPNILFPYARETLDSLVTRGSFPALMLAPVNFDALYAQELSRMQSAGEGMLN
jgi:preprotein translocase subunit SecB